MVDKLKDFICQFEQMKHNWNSTRKLNGYVNNAIGVEMFSTDMFPCKLEIDNGIVTLITPDESYAAEELDFDAERAVQMVEVCINDSECS